MTARQSWWRVTFAGISVGVYDFDGVSCEWWDLPPGVSVSMLDGRVLRKAER